MQRNEVILGGVDYSGIAGSELTRVIITNNPELNQEEK
jgi:hypothetical protein